MALVLVFHPAVSMVSAQVLTFEQVVAHGLRHSFESRIIDREIRAARAGVDESLADRYPSLGIRLGNEYVHVFDEESEVVSVGDAIIANDVSGFKHSLIATARYTLYDFGIRGLNTDHARRLVRIAELRDSQARLETQTTLLDLYARGLKTQARIRTLTEISGARQAIFRMAQRLHQAGSLGRDRLGETALDSAETLSRLEDQRIIFRNLLEEISFHTQQSYNWETLVLEDFSLPETPVSHTEPAFHPEIAIYDRRIENKRTELSMAKRSDLPRFTLQNAFRLVGSDENNFAGSMGDLRSRDLSLTLYVEYPLFDGFANRAKKRRLYHEIAGLEIQREKRLSELRREFTTALNTYTASVALKSRNREQSARIREQQIVHQRLARQQINDQMTVHNQMIELARQELDIRIQGIDAGSAALRLELMQGAGS